MLVFAVVLLWCFGSVVGQLSTSKTAYTTNIAGSLNVSYQNSACSTSVLTPCTYTVPTTVLKVPLSPSTASSIQYFSAVSKAYTSNLNTATATTASAISARYSYSITSSLIRSPSTSLMKSAYLSTVGTKSSLSYNISSGSKANKKTSFPGPQSTQASAFLTANPSIISSSDASFLFGSNKLLGFGTFSIFPTYSNRLNYGINGTCMLWVDPCLMLSQIRTDVTILDATGAPAFPGANLQGAAHNQSCGVPTFNSFFSRFPQYRADIPYNRMTMSLSGPSRSNMTLYNYALPPQNKPASWMIYDPVTNERMVCCSFEFAAYPTCSRPTPACPRTCVATLVLFSCAAFAMLSVCLGCFLQAQQRVSSHPAACDRPSFPDPATRQIVAHKSDSVEVQSAENDSGTRREPVPSKNSVDTHNVVPVAKHPEQTTEKVLTPRDSIEAQAAKLAEEGAGSGTKMQEAYSEENFGDAFATDSAKDLCSTASDALSGPVTRVGSRPATGYSRTVASGSHDNARLLLKEAALVRRISDLEQRLSRPPFVVPQSQHSNYVV